MQTSLHAGISPFQITYLHDHGLVFLPCVASCEHLSDGGHNYMLCYAMSCRVVLCCAGELGHACHFLASQGDGEISEDMNPWSHVERYTSAVVTTHCPLAYVVKLCEEVLCIVGCSHCSYKPQIVELRCVYFLIRRCTIFRRPC